VALPEADTQYLSERDIAHQVVIEGSTTSIIFPGWSLPGGYDRTESDLLIRLQAGYPDIPPDMWWFDPAIRLATGQQVAGTEASESHLGRSWQRWSRHLRPDQWQSGRDGLEGFLALIRRELLRGAGAA
jgi:E2/UBC family protein E